MKVIRNRVLSALLFGKTENLRVFFALCSFGWGLWVLTDSRFEAEHAATVAFVPIPQLGILFLVHGFAMFYGVWTGRYSVWLLFLEGLLGAFLWVGVGIAESYGQQAIGPTLFGGLCALFLLIRYPTHYAGSRNG